MELALTAIFQNEERFLKEWIDFHRQIGFEFFYLFDHCSTDHSAQVLKPYIKEGVVKLTHWPLSYSDVYEWTEVQCLAYERAIHFLTGKTKWLAILDVDEYLFPNSGDLKTILQDFEPYGGVCVNWQVYGTSNVAKLKGKMVDELIFKAPKEHVTNHHVKSIVRPERVKGLDNAHSMMYKEGFYQVDTKKKGFTGCLSPTIEIDLLRINHYTLRDEEYLHTHKIPRLQKWWPEWAKGADWKAKYAPLNLVKDRAILYHSCHVN